MLDPDNRDAKSRLSKEVVSQLDAGEDVVVVRRAGRIEATTRMPGSRRAYLYVLRAFYVHGFQQSQRASIVLADYNSLFDRSRHFQFRFTRALYPSCLRHLALTFSPAL